VVDVWAGGRCSYFQDEDSQVWVCGDNSRGQLGIKNDEGKSIVCPPMRSPMLEGYELYPGSKHLICVSGDCTVYGLGDNRYGQLGITKEIQETRDLIPVGLNLSNSNKVKSARSSSMLE
jgi:alpha-tubulin suppressor-like RCC1 family protein